MRCATNGLLASKNKVGELEDVFEKVDVTSHEDESDRRGKGDCGGTRVLPL